MSRCSTPSAAASASGSSTVASPGNRGSRRTTSASAADNNGSLLPRRFLGGHHHLESVKRRVPAVQPHQFVVRAALHLTVTVQTHNQIGARCQTQVVRDQER